jgi:hypothetical protein
VYFILKDYRLQTWGWKGSHFQTGFLGPGPSFFWALPVGNDNIFLAEISCFKFFFLKDIITKIWFYRALSEILCFTSWQKGILRHEQLHMYICKFFMYIPVNSCRTKWTAILYKKHKFDFFLSLTKFKICKYFRYFILNWGVNNHPRKYGDYYTGCHHSSRNWDRKGSWGNF